MYIHCGVIMTATTLSSREFNHDAAAAKRAAQHGPVYVTNRGRLEVVILSAAEYQRLAGQRLSIVDLLHCPAAAEVDIEFARQADQFREIEL